MLLFPLFIFNRVISTHQYFRDFIYLVPEDRHEAGDLPTGQLSVAESGFCMCGSTEDTRRVMRAEFGGH